MHITLSPMRHDTPLHLVRSGDRLSFNGIEYDFTALPDQAVLPQAAVDCPWLAADVIRKDGILHLCIILPHGATAPQNTLFPPVLFAAQDGPIPLPAFEEMPA